MRRNLDAVDCPHSAEYQEFKGGFSGLAGEVLVLVTG